MPNDYLPGGATDAAAKAWSTDRELFKQIQEVEDFIEFLTGKARRRAALDRLLAIAPALEVAGAEPITEEEVATEINAARAERRARQSTKVPGADHP
ncbi:MAG: hypothetical protein AB1421_12440 [Pseudomonadota bacterium]